MNLNQLAKLCAPSDARFHVRTVKTSADTFHAFAAFDHNGDPTRGQIETMLDQAAIPYRAMRDGDRRMIVVKVDL